MTIEYIGFGEILKLMDILRRVDSKVVLLVTGRESYRTSVAREDIESILSEYEVIEFPTASPIPDILSVTNGTNTARRRHVDTVLGIGGGNALDTAKSIAALAQQPNGKFEDYVKGKRKLEKPALKKILIPTTAGSGSEATHFAVVYINGEKVSFADQRIAADYSIVDPNLTMTLPKYITAYTGMDALSQALEAFWSVKATEESKRHSRQALVLVLPALKSAVLEGTRESRQAMAYGANLAGKAINLAQTTAPHSISYPITSNFSIPHGHAVALTLPSFVVFNSGVTEEDSQDPRGIGYVRETLAEAYSLLGVGDPYQARTVLNNLIDSVALERRLSRLGIHEENLGVILEKGFNPQRVVNNPRRLTKEDLSRVLHSIL